MTITRQRRRAISAAATMCALVALATSLAQAQTFTILHRFPAGTNPYALIADPAGNFYGTTSDGGPSNAGTVYRLDRTGKTVLYSFNGTDGSSPGSLVRDSAGNLYGTAESSGFPCINGCGFVFKLDITRALTTLYDFPDGYIPYNLIRGPQGNLYGFTQGGGTAGGGVVFQLDTSGAETMLHNFAGGDGFYPESLILGPPGTLYGSTLFGGKANAGVVYKLDQTGETVLYSFTISSSTIPEPISQLQDSAGNLYGFTEYGGSQGCFCGQVFKLDPSGAYTVLYTFTGAADGGIPSSLILDPSGNLYGTTSFGGIDQCYQGCGVVFQLDTTGKYTVLYSFHGKPDGASPYSLIRGPEGNLYGLANNGKYPAIVFRIRP